MQGGLTMRLTWVMTPLYLNYGIVTVGCTLHDTS